VVVLILSAIPVNAQNPDSATAQNSDSAIGFVDVIGVNGLIDPVMVDFIDRSLDAAVEGGALAVVLQMESEGAAVDDESLGALADRIAGFEIPVSVWLGPAGKGKALGGAGQLAIVSTRIGISPGSEIGDFGPSVLGNAASDAPFVSLLEGGFAGGVVGYDELVQLGADDASLQIQNAPTILNHLLELPGFDFGIVQPGEVLPNGGILADDAGPSRIPITRTRFVTLPLIDQQFHTFASPPVAYLLFVIGLGLLVFELYTAGVGVAGVIGAGSFLAGGYGLAVLDARWWAVLLLLIAFIGFAIDVQSGIQAFWSTVGSIFLIIGSLFLLGDYSIGWLPLGVGIIGILLAMLGGMPAMVRTRFSTPTIGREWMIGEVGEVIEAVDPDGVVSFQGAPWRARTNRATPIAVGEQARVVEVDGLLLEVEPELGAAIDYRERRSSEAED
jgi:membrane-bound serine protease (ClpP class)